MSKINNIIIIFILTVVIYPLRSETNDYKALISPNKSWTICTHSSGVNGPYDAFDVYYNVQCYFNGDTIVNGTKYCKLYTDSELTSLVREDVEHQKVFIIPIKCRMNNDNTEYVLYDFSVSVGDIVQSYYGLEWCPNCHQPQTLITNVEYDEGLKIIQVKYLIDGEYEGENEWIESIGGLAGPDKPYSITLCGGNEQYLLQKCNEGDNVLYENKNTQCLTTSNITEVSAHGLLTIDDDVLTLKGIDHGSAAIYSADGRQVMTFTGNAADISSLPHGLYIVRAGAKTAKFVK